MSDFNYSFTSRKKSVMPNAAIETTSIYIPFQDEMHLENSGGVTDKCFFLKDKVSGELFRWNEAMASDGRSFYLPVYDIRLLQTEEYADYKKVLVKNGNIQQVELENLLSPAINKSAADAVVRQIESGEVDAKFIDTSVLPEVQREGDLMSENIAKVVSAAKRGPKPKVKESA
jgi:hypothetical protein